MAISPDEAMVYTLVPFIRHWASSDEHWSTIGTVYQALNVTCTNLTTQWHWAIFPVMSSLLTRARFEEKHNEGTMAKSYPPSVVTVVAQKPMAAVVAWQDGFDKALSMLHEWSMSLSPLLTEELRILLREVKSAVKDFCLLLRAAILKKQSSEDWEVKGDELEV